MFSIIFHFIYCLSYIQLTLMLLLFTLAAAICCRLLLRKKWSVPLFAACFGLTLLVILYMALVHRTDGTLRAVHLLPGRMIRLYLATGDEENIRTLAMNIAFFVPFGAFAEAALRCGSCGWSFRKRLLLIILAGFLLSLLLEGGQYLLACGESEADDLVTNTLGAGIGCALVAIWCRVLPVLRKLAVRLWHRVQQRRNNKKPSA